MTSDVPNPASIPTPGSRIDRYAGLPFLLTWFVWLVISSLITTGIASLVVAITVSFRAADGEDSGWLGFLICGPLAFVVSFLVFKWSVKRFLLSGI